MPILIPCSELKPGMQLSRPLLEREALLLAANRELTIQDIKALRRRCPRTHVHVIDPILDELLEFEDDGREREVADRVRYQIADAMTEVQQRFADRATLKDVDIAKTRRTVDEVVDYLERHPTSAALLTSALNADDYLAHHIGNVFYLCTLLATAVRDYVLQERRRQTLLKNLSPATLLNLTPLGLGAMFIDVGVLPLRHLFARERVLTPEERDLVRRHPQRGVEMLPENFPTFARVVVRTHHENCDGSGYPNRVARDDLHVFTRIIRIADAYDAATSTHVFRRAKSPARVLWEMTVGPYRHFYDPVLMRVFARLIQPFPIGTKLRLADGRYAVVVKYNRQEPLRPHLVIAFDRDAQRLSQSQLEGPFVVGERPGVHVSFWGKENIADLYADEAANVDPVRAREFKTLFEAAYP